MIFAASPCDEVQTFAVGVLEIPQVTLVALPAAVVVVARTLPVLKVAYF